MSEIRRHRVTEAGPVYDQLEIDAVMEVLEAGLGDLGPRVAEFERRGAAHARQVARRDGELRDVGVVAGRRPPRAASRATR